MNSEVLNGAALNAAVQPPRVFPTLIVARPTPRPGACDPARTVAQDK